MAQASASNTCSYAQKKPRLAGVFLFLNINGHNMSIDILSSSS